MSLRTFADIGQFIFVNDEPRPADAILIPGGSVAELGEHAARLYALGLAPLIVPSGKFAPGATGFPGPRTKVDLYPGPYDRESTFLRDVLERSGVPSNAILEEPEAMYTMDNALKSKELLDREGIHLQTGILVCKPFHARRVLMSYELAFPETTFFVCPYGDDKVNRENWLTTEEGRQRVLGELKRCGEHYVEAIKGFLQAPRQGTKLSPPFEGDRTGQR